MSGCAAWARVERVACRETGMESGMRAMNRMIGAVVLAAMMTAACGCSATSHMVAHRTVTNKQWFGDAGVTGHLNNVIVQAGSHVTKFSIIGDGNKVYFEEGTTLGKIEIWGENNVISVPAVLYVRDSRVGHGNIVEHRARGALSQYRDVGPAEHPYAEKRPAAEAPEPVDAPATTAPATGGGADE